MSNITQEKANFIEKCVEDGNARLATWSFPGKFFWFDHREETRIVLKAVGFSKDPRKHFFGFVYYEGPSFFETEYALKRMIDLEVEVAKAVKEVIDGETK